MSVGAWLTRCGGSRSSSKPLFFVQGGMNDLSVPVLRGGFAWVDILCGVVRMLYCSGNTEVSGDLING